jgi:VanZ family protein
LRLIDLSAAGFLILLFLASAGGLLPHSAFPKTPASPVPQTDKFLHFITFFALTATFYFILDTTRRRILHLTLFVCTFALGVGSEVLQGLLPNDRDFDPWDVLANVVGSLAALGLASAYHRRSMDRRRRAKYSALTGEGIEGEEDLELGESGFRPGESSREELEGQETGVIPVASKTVEEELDNWDENAADDAWDEEDDATGTSTAGTKITPASSSVGDEDAPKKIAVD